MNNQTFIYDGSYNLETEQKNRSSKQFIPENIGVGISYNKNKITWGIDYQYYKWKGLNSGFDNIKVTNSYLIKAGVGYSVGETFHYRQKQSNQIQLGASFGKSYLTVREKNSFNYSVSGGYSFHIGKNRSLLNCGLEYGNSWCKASDYIKESYFLLNVNFSISERSFKQKEIK